MIQFARYSYIPIVTSNRIITLVCARHLGWRARHCQSPQQVQKEHAPEWDRYGAGWHSHLREDWRLLLFDWISASAWHSSTCNRSLLPSAAATKIISLACCMRHSTVHASTSSCPLHHLPLFVPISVYVLDSINSTIFFVFMVFKLATLLADRTVLLHGVASFGQKLGSILELYSRLQLLMRRFGEGRVVTINGCGQRVVRGMWNFMLLHVDC